MIYVAKLRKGSRSETKTEALPKCDEVIPALEVRTFTGGSVPKESS